MRNLCIFKLIMIRIPGWTMEAFKSPLYKGRFRGVKEDI